MTPRKASLRVAHQAHCPNRNQTTLTSVDARCRAAKCRPSYYTFHRDRSGAVIKGPRVKDRRVAERALERLQRDIDEGRVGITRERNVSFPEWADMFIDVTADRVSAGDLKSRTLSGYRESLDWARESIGYVNVREIGVAELRRFYGELVRLSPASRIRHLKHLNACLAAAVDEGYAAVNPLPLFKKKLKLRVPKRGKAPFEDGELERMWAAMLAPSNRISPVYLYVAKFSVESGARLGELIGADWTDLDLMKRTFRVERTYNAIDGTLEKPKDGEPRTVYLTDYAIDVLQDWMVIAGPRSAGPLFDDPHTGARLNPRNVQRNLEKAMKKAGVPKLHPDLHLPRSFHSFRYTTSNVLQRRGFHPRFIEQLLGHGSLELSYGIYGGWTPGQLAAEAARVPVAR